MSPACAAPPKAPCPTTTQLLLRAGKEGCLGAPWYTEVGNLRQLVTQ